MSSKVFSVIYALSKGHSPVGAASSDSMPLLRSFGFSPFARYKAAAPLGLRKASLLRHAGADWDGFPAALPLANHRCRCRTFRRPGAHRVVEPEGVIKCITVIHLILASSVTRNG